MNSTRPSARFRSRAGERVTASAPGGFELAQPVETRPIEELKDCDIFLSYASIDDQPVVSSRQGWITQFNRNLKVRLEQLLGESVRMWPQANPLGHEPTRPDVLQRLPDVRTLVSVLSPPFVRSDGCRSQATAFWRATEERGRFQVENQPRMFKVVKTPVDTRELPSDVAPLFKRLKSFEFFEWDPDTGRLREFDEAFGDLSRQHYHERVYDVAYEISQLLKTLQGRAGGTTTPGESSKVDLPRRHDRRPRRAARPTAARTDGAGPCGRARPDAAGDFKRAGVDRPRLPGRVRPRDPPRRRPIRPRAGGHRALDRRVAESNRRRGERFAGVWRG